MKEPDADNGKALRLHLNLLKLFRAAIERPVHRPPRLEKPIMQLLDRRTLCTVRSTAYNNEIAAELLQELVPLTGDVELARRMRCAARQLLRDANALESLGRPGSDR